MRPKPLAWIPVLLLIAFLSACGGTGAGDGAQGKVSIALTDAPGFEFDNVWITVREAWFHRVESAPFASAAGGWVRFPLAGPVTLNLATLADGNLQTVWDNLPLSVGTYRQILLFLEPTENPPVSSALAQIPPLLFNNQVDAGTLRAPLRIPNAANGLRLAGTFQVAEGATLRLAIDFDIGHDVVRAPRGTRTEFVLKPRLRFFDLGNAGAIVGFVDNTAAADNTAFFIVKAEQMNGANTFREVRRAARIDNTTGRFVLFPVAPGSYDIVIRGRNWETVVVDGVPAVAGTTKTSGFTRVGTQTSPIPMTPGTDYLVGATASPTGAWAEFHQTLSGPGEKPYLVRFRHFNPLSGSFDGFPLSTGPIHADTWNLLDYSGGPIVLSTVIPVGGNGAFTLIADALLHDPSGSPVGLPNVDPSDADTVVPLTALGVTAPAASNSVGGFINFRSGTTPLDNLVAFATFGGMIVNAQSLGAVPILSPPISYSITNLPGGQIGTPLPFAFYFVSAFGTSGTDNILRVGIPDSVANLQTGNDVVNVLMIVP